MIGRMKPRSKWLIAIALGTCAYVVIAPKETATTEPARGGVVKSRSAAVRGAHAAGGENVGSALQQLTHRVRGQAASASLFAAHSWYVAPPPPPAPPVETVKGPPPKPTAPPLPFTYMGSYAPNGVNPVFFLTEGDRVFDVHVGDTLDNTYTVDAFSNGALILTYKPLNQQQQLQTGGGP